ncbi:sugar phosphate isomerase/epimerase family protein [Lederbergia wuyishanensis]|uniref:Sugar phosphate isomerase/epimerase n=1 Tax=Lederbergia wuyishanensis TaxID=1347903 RepID=A0ABU0DA44_9BACI|nr:sugar phosphate isomerase/epimerase [Lederbergia wuyishanensis]MCJ8009929.1 sugar phosphate isomerase/epimerase [Lederbergia wuyishanensis]MDQ0345276.1 sugar phosphate isomerase/epimerase [Lederbergia wuyishanensis]
MNWALMTANYVAEESGYAISHGWLQGGDWGKCHNVTVENYQGIKFADKFERLIYKIKQMGYNNIELWSAHLDPSIANIKMIDEALKILEKNDVNIISYYAVGFDRSDYTENDIRRNFDVAKELGVSMITQTIINQNAPIVHKLAEEYSMKIGWENHPEKNSAEIIHNIKSYSPIIRSALDTGWLGTYNCDAAQVIRELKDSILHVHLKDVKAVGGHDSCALGDGIVDIKGVLEALKDINYQGKITVEHEPHNFDPTNELMESLTRIKSWWNEIERRAEV